MNNLTWLWAIILLAKNFACSATELSQPTQIPAPSAVTDQQAVKETSRVLNDTPQMMVMRMLEYTLEDGGLAYETEIQQLKIKIANLPKPEKGNTKIARKINNQGLQAIKKADYEKSVELFKQAYEFDKSDVETLTNLGNAYIKQGNLDSAQQTLTTVYQ